eukprot:153048-Amphidinium_carterae.1
METSTKKASKACDSLTSQLLNHLDEQHALTSYRLNPTNGGHTNEDAPEHEHMMSRQCRGKCIGSLNTLDHGKYQTHHT